MLMIYIQYHRTSQQQLLYLLFANLTLFTYRLNIALAENKWQKKFPTSVLSRELGTKGEDGLTPDQNADG